MPDNYEVGSSGIAVKKTSPIIIPSSPINRDEANLSRGNVPELAHARSKLEQLTGAKLKITSTGLEVPPATLTIPVDDQAAIHILTDKEIMEQNQEKKAPPSKRSGSEMALAAFDLPQFLAREAKNRLEADPQTQRYLDEVVTNIEALTNFRASARPLSENKSTYSVESMQRVTSTKTYFDKVEDTKKEYTQSKPGVVETAAIAIVDLLREPDFQGELGERVIICLSELLRKYRTQTNTGLEVPEMPELVHEITETLQGLYTQRENRFKLYDVLSQITISPDQAGEVIERMDTFKDLDHPLAYQLTLAIAESQPEHSWVKIQEERRNNLLGNLVGSNQDLFERYSELVRQSRGLVFSGDIHHPPQGKVGMEFEYGKRYVDPDEESLRRDWINGKDLQTGIPEMRRADEALEYNQTYRQSLVNLTRWFQDEATHLSSLHVHLDKVRHPYRPDLGNLYDSAKDETLKVNSRLGTWEIRALFPPILRGSLQPSHVTDAVELYLHTTTEGQTYPSQKITIAEGGIPPSINRLIFGHIAGYISSPEGRLALLMSLHASFMMQAINPFALASSYERNSIPSIVTAFQRIDLDIGMHRSYIALLGLAHATNFGEGLGLERGVDAPFKSTFIRQAMESSDPSDFRKQIEEMSHLQPIKEKLQTGQQLTGTDLAFLYGIDELDHPTKKNTHIQRILSQRKVEEDMLTIFDCTRKQIANTVSGFNKDTKAFVGKLTAGIFTKRQALNIEHVYTAFPERKIRIENLTIGGKSREQLPEALKKGRFKVSEYAEEMLKSDDFTTAENPKDIDLVRLKVADLGLSDYSTTDQINAKAEEFGLDPCPPEVGPYLRLSYTNQPLDERVYVAMKQIADRDGHPRVFRLVCSDDGLWLDEERADPMRRWRTGDEFVFCDCQQMQAA